MLWTGMIRFNGRGIFCRALTEAGIRVRQAPYQASLKSELLKNLKTRAQPQNTELVRVSPCHLAGTIQLEQEPTERTEAGVSVEARSGKLAMAYHSVTQRPHAKRQLRPLPASVSSCELLNGYGLENGSGLRIRQPRPALGLALGLALCFAGSAPSATNSPGNAGLDLSDQLFKGETALRLRIEIPDAGLEVLRAYEFRKGSNPDNRTNVAATVREGARVYTNVAVHLKGSLGSFRPIDDKPALTLNFDKFADGQRFYGLQKLHLNNSVQDPSYVSETISRELFSAAGLPSPRATHAVVELNGRPLGLYVLAEGWNKQFLKRHFKNTRGNLWDSGSAGDITEMLDTNSGEDPGDTSRLETLIDLASDTTATNRLTRLATVLDVDRFLDFMAMEVMLAHWDGYCLNKNNYRLFHDQSTDCLIFLPHGLDQMFGVYRMTPTSPITPMMKGLVAKAVAQTPEGRRRYLERMGQLATNLFDVGRLTNRVNELSARVQKTLSDDPRAQLQQKLAATQLNSRIARRGLSVREQLAQASKPIQFGANNEFPLTGWRISRDSGSPSFSRQSAPQDVLEVRANGNRAYGSWRTLAFVDAGNYQFTGKIKLLNPQYEQGVAKGGAALRISGEREAQMITEANDWRTFIYDFTAAGPVDLELVCEFRASQGRALFDASSLKLVRKPAGKAN